MVEYFINGRFLTQSLTGVQRYAFEMVRELDQLLAERSEEEFKVKFTILAPRANLTDLKLKKIRLKQVGWLGGYFWEQFELPIFSAGSPLVNFGNICPLLKRNQFLTIHDMTVFRTPENFSLSFRMFYKIFFRLLKFKEVKLITISEFSREEIKKYYRQNTSQK